VHSEVAPATTVAPAAPGKGQAFGERHFLLGLWEIHIFNMINFLNYIP
jgi:uncharacterized protein YktB (UPF0637 family)